jgi:hypothetical protein
MSFTFYFLLPFSILVGLLSWIFARSIPLRCVLIIFCIDYIFNKISHHLNQDVIRWILRVIGITQDYLLLYVCYKLNATYRSGRIYLIAAAIVSVIYPLEIVFNTFFTLPHSVTFSIVITANIFAACLYFYRVFHKEYHPLLPDPLFWLAASMLLQILDLLFFFTFTDAISPGTGTYIFLVTLHSVVDIIYYLLIICAFIICIRYKTQELSPMS